MRAAVGAGSGSRRRRVPREGLARAERRPASRRAEEKFAFDRVFGPDATQSDVYAEVSPLVVGALDGFSACVFAYGQTGGGRRTRWAAPRTAPRTRKR